MVGLNTYVKWSLSLFVNNKQLMGMAVGRLLNPCILFLVPYQLMQLRVSIYITITALWAAEVHFH